MKKSLLVAAVAIGLISISTTANAFSTTGCMSCHAIGFAKVGPSFKAIVDTYGSEKALTKAFDDGFAMKDRLVAKADAKWARKASLMTTQYRILIKGHGKEAAHAIFETVKNNNFGKY